MVYKSIIFLFLSLIMRHLVIIVFFIIVCFLAVFLFIRRNKRLAITNVSLVRDSYKRLAELVHTSLLKGWNKELFRSEVESGRPYREQEMFYTKVYLIASSTYPGLIEWLEKYYPELNQGDIVCVCFIISDWKTKEIHNVYPIWSVGAIDTRRSRIYKSLGFKIDIKDPLSFIKFLVDVRHPDKM
ncbi:MAG: hypothetical protein LBC84_02235 [Prevotellaceae bacterium]|nr:hypothetical protein [Prevotellaceae bacterium]